MSGANQHSEDFDKRVMDFLESNDLVGLYADAGETELRALIENADLLREMGDIDFLSEEKEKRMDKAINAEWQKEQARPSTNFFERLKAIGSGRPSGNMNFGRFTIPVAVAAVILLAFYLPTIKSMLINFAGSTVSSLSGSLADNAQLSTGFYGFILAVAVILLFVISRREK